MSGSLPLLNYDVGSWIWTSALCQIIVQHLSLMFFLTPFLHFFPPSLSFSRSLWFLQEAIDIFEGVRDDQALCMAANLGFKGPLQRQVCGCTEGLKCTMQRRGRMIYDALTIIHTGRYILIHKQTKLQLLFVFQRQVLKCHYTTLTCQVVYCHIWQWRTVLLLSEGTWHH